MKQIFVTRLIGGVALAAAVVSTAAQAEETAPAPAVQVETVAPAEVKKTTVTKPVKVEVPAAATAPKTTSSKAKPAPAVETLPWATGETVAAPAAQSAAKSAEPKGAAGKEATVKPAALPCPGLFEAACREMKACAWIADIRRPDGSEVKAQCVDKVVPGGKKNEAKKQPAALPKKAEAQVKPAAKSAPEAAPEAAKPAAAEKTAAPAVPVKVEPPQPAAAGSN